ncbi:MAG TPA: hypothetical protein VM123_19075 [archaeon]|nr:hypothetical protein [archaeon]
MAHKYIILTLIVAVFSALSGTLQAQEKTKKPAGAPVDSAAAAAKADSTLARADSTLLLKKNLSAEDYISQREQFFYPSTQQKDPFDLPFGRAAGAGELGPGIGGLELSGVLYSIEGRSIAILNLPEGESFLVREGDMLGSAQVVLIEPSSVKFVIKEYGQVFTILKELKPLVEAKK